MEINLAAGDCFSCNSKAKNLRCPLPTMLLCPVRSGKSRPIVKRWQLVMFLKKVKKSKNRFYQYTG